MARISVEGIVNRVHEKLKGTGKKSLIKKEIIEHVFNVIIEFLILKLSSEETVKIKNFGKFEVFIRQERNRHDPVQQQVVFFPALKKIRFKLNHNFRLLLLRKKPIIKERNTKHGKSKETSGST